MRKVQGLTEGSSSTLMIWVTKSSALLTTSFIFPSFSSYSGTISGSCPTWTPSLGAFSRESTFSGVLEVFSSAGVRASTSGPEVAILGYRR
jgi:hypothetical protein